MPAARHRFVVEQGATWPVRLSLRDTAGTLDLSGFSARFQIRESADAPLTLLSLSTSSSGGITIDGPAGTVSWTVTDEVTGAWAWRHGVFGLTLTSPSGADHPLLKGEVLVHPAVVR